MNERIRRGRHVWKWTLAVVAVVAIIILLVSRFYGTVQAPRWNALDRAAATAAELAGLLSVDEVERFIGDRPYSIVYGIDAEEVPVIVWLWEEDGIPGFHVERQDAGVTRETVRDASLAQRQGSHLLRVTAGKLGDNFVWEVFTEVEEAGGTRKYYDYYRFNDGAKIETYRLAIEG